ncbi:amidohydrolase family protein [Luminiphilus sp.]|jgi:imidazolonepropionase-like amidohydrolase|nr:amidohydrolase family protein [Luminiphilus sp.]
MKIEIRPDSGRQLRWLHGLARSLLLAVISATAQAESQLVLFTGVNVFDGRSESLASNTDVLVEGNMIKQLGANLNVADATVINGEGRTLMPGLIEAHGHIIGAAFSATELVSTYWDAVGAKMLVRAQDYFNMGFTTVRDGGAWALGTKQAIDDGTAVGPRILSPGSGISQTGGHGDFRLPYQNNPFFSPAARNPENSILNFLGATRTADGVPEVRKLARTNLAAGAHFLKVMGGGGIYSQMDPLTSLQYSIEELRAVAEEASNYGTYATIHVHLDEAVDRAIDAGFKMIEHATIMEEDTVRKMARHDVIWSMQTSVFLADPKTHPSIDTEVQRAKAQVVHDGLKQTIKYARKHKLKTLWGTDIIGPRDAFLKLFPTEWSFRNEYYTPFEQLQQVTRINGEAIALSGVKNPYPDGPLGVIEAGAYADILLIDGNPLEDILVLQNYEDNIDLIMKDGKIYKNTLAD